MAPKFPLQQGTLDDLCSVYAIINFLHLESDGEIDFERGAKIFQKGIKAVAKYEVATKGKMGTLKGLVAQGNDPENFVWLYGKMGETRHGLEHKKTVSAANMPALVYFEVNPSPIKDFTHYSVVRSVNKDGDMVLFDSYGFSNIMYINQKYFLLHDDGSRGEVVIHDVWTNSK